MLLAVELVEGADLRAPENQRGQRAVPGRVQRDGFAGRIEHQHFASRIDASRQREGRDVKSGVTNEIRFRTERQSPHSRMQPIRADDQVEAARRSTLKFHVDPLPVVLGQRGDGIPEDELRAVAACRMKDI